MCQKAIAQNACWVLGYLLIVLSYLFQGCSICLSAVGKGKLFCNFGFAGGFCANCKCACPCGVACAELYFNRLLKPFIKNVNPFA